MLRNRRNLGVLSPIIRDFETQPKRVAYALHRGKVVKSWLVGLEANYAIEDNPVVIEKSLPGIMNLLMDTFKEQRKTDEWVLEFATALNKAFRTDVTPILDKRAELDAARAEVEAKEREIVSLKATLEAKDYLEPGFEDEPTADNKYGVNPEDIDNFSEDELIALGAEMNMDVNKILGSEDDFSLLRSTLSAKLVSELPSSGLVIGVTVNDKTIEIKPTDPFDFMNANKDQLLEYGYKNNIEGIAHKLNVDDLRILIEDHELTKQKSSK